MISSFYTNSRYSTFFVLSYSLPLESLLSSLLLLGSMSFCFRFLLDMLEIAKCSARNPSSSIAVRCRSWNRFVVPILNFHPLSIFLSSISISISGSYGLDFAVQIGLQHHHRKQPPTRRFEREHRIWTPVSSSSSPSSTPSVTPISLPVGIFTTHLKYWAHCSQSNVQEPCKKSMYKVVSAAYVVIIFSYWLLAFLGYWAFGVNVNSMFQSKSESNGNTDDSRQENYIGHLKWRCNMGPPTFSPGHSFAMMSAVFVSLVESTGAYKAASRLAIATPLPAYVLSRGIGWQISFFISPFPIGKTLVHYAIHFLFHISVEMDRIEKESEEASEVELILSEASNPNSLFNIPLVEPRDGEEYQSEIPPLLTQSQPFELSADPIESEATADAASHAFLM